MDQLPVGFACEFGFCHTWIERELLEVIVVGLHLGKFLFELLIFKDFLLEGTKPDSIGSTPFSYFGVFGVEEDACFVFGGLCITHQ